MTHPTGRTADHAIDPIYLDRWSPRAFTGEAMPQETLLSLFEAARWAPSAANGQPWRFVYGHRGTEAFERIYNTLDEGNRRWADKAAVLAVIISQTHRANAAGEMRPAYTHAFDTGAAWAYLALEATRAGYHSHGMGGIDREKGKRSPRRTREFSRRGGSGDRQNRAQGDTAGGPHETRGTERAQEGGRVRLRGAIRALKRLALCHQPRAKARGSTVAVEAWMAGSG